MSTPDCNRPDSPLKEPNHAAQTLLGALILCLVLAAASAMAVLHGGPSGRGGPEWNRIVMVIAGVCAASSLGGWFVARLGARDPALAVSGSLGAIALRLVLPLMLLGWLSADPAAVSVAGKLREAGAGGLLVVFYLTLLATDILLHIMWGPKGPIRPRPGA